MIRSTAIGSLTRCAADCSDRPVANNRWMTSSWRSRAIRSAFVDEAGRPRLLVQPGILDRQSGGDSKTARQLFVDIGEQMTIGLVGHVQDPVHHTPQADRHPEERGHRRMPRRKAEVVGMHAQIRQAHRLRLVNQQAENSMTLGSRTDVRDFVVVETNRDELGQVRT